MNKPVKESRAKSSFDVHLVETHGSDILITSAAKNSILGPEDSLSYLKFIISKRSGHHFEHGAMTFKIFAPLFVWEEFMQHHRGAIYSEQCSRETEFEGVFYIPDANRKISPIGDPQDQLLVEGYSGQYQVMTSKLMESYDVAWQAYLSQIYVSISSEVARLCLPMAIYQTAYLTMTIRSIMTLLSLTTNANNSVHQINSQWEVSNVADQIELLFKDKFPLSHTAFDQSGRISP